MDQEMVKVKLLIWELASFEQLLNSLLIFVTNLYHGSGGLHMGLITGSLGSGFPGIQQSSSSSEVNESFSISFRNNREKAKGLLNHQLLLQNKTRNSL